MPTVALAMNPLIVRYWMTMRPLGYRITWNVRCAGLGGLVVERRSTSVHCTMKRVPSLWQRALAAPRKSRSSQNAAIRFSGALVLGRGSFEKSVEALLSDSQPLVVTRTLVK